MISSCARMEFTSETYTGDPFALIARDGEMLVDDVGGLGGFAEFLEKIHPELKGMDPDEKEQAKCEKKELLEWAKSLGWHRDNSTDLHLL